MELTIHRSYLDPFFREMESHFKGNWCVLHSYEQLPGYSESDVDMAFSDNRFELLENLIHRVGQETGWTVYQKLWPSTTMSPPSSTTRSRAF